MVGSEIGGEEIERVLEAAEHWLSDIMYYCLNFVWKILVYNCLSEVKCFHIQ